MFGTYFTLCRAFMIDMDKCFGAKPPFSGSPRFCGISQ